MLQVNEIFGPTIQGEGKTAGKEVSFLRLTNCNLDCIWCDTPYTWNWKNSSHKHTQKYDKRKELHHLSNEQILAQLEAIGVKSVVISGGEPMLQQKKLIELLVELKQRNYWIEVETNGTIPIHLKVLSLVDQFNCSPKLSNSEVDRNKRTVPNVLMQLSQSRKANFKFVASSEMDLVEIKFLVKQYKMREVYIMAEGRTVNELQNKKKWLQKFCDKYHFHFTERLHIIELGGGRAI